MKRSFVCFLTFFLCLIMISTCFSVAEADNEPIETLISTVIQSSYPGCQLFDYAPIGQEKTEYIVIAVDSEEMPAVMIVNTEQPSAEMKVYGLSMKHSLEMNGVNCIGSNTATKISSSIFSFPGMI